MTIFTNFAKLFCGEEITMYKIYVLSSKESQLPYEVEGVKNDLSKEIKWKFIGEVDDLEVAREMVIKDRVYQKKNDKEYILELIEEGEHEMQDFKFSISDKVLVNDESSSPSSEGSIKSFSSIVSETFISADSL